MDEEEQDESLDLEFLPKTKNSRKYKNKFTSKLTDNNVNPFANYNNQNSSYFNMDKKNKENQYDVKLILKCFDVFRMIYWKMFSKN